MTNTRKPPKLLARLRPGTSKDLAQKMRTDTYDELTWKLVPVTVPRAAYEVLECIEANHSTSLYGSYQAMWADLLGAVPGVPEVAPVEEGAATDGSEFGCPIHYADAERLALLAGGRHVQGGMVFTPEALQNLLLAARCAKDETLRDDCSADAHRAAWGAHDE